MSGEAETHHVELGAGVNALLEPSTLATNKQHWACCKCNNLGVKGNGDRKCFGAGWVHNKCDDCQSWDDTPTSLNSTIERESTAIVFDYDFMRPKKNGDLQIRWLRPFTTITPASPSRTLQNLPGPKSWLNPPRPPLPPRPVVKDVADESNVVPWTSRQSPSDQPSSRFVQAIANAPPSSAQTSASLFPPRRSRPERSTPPSHPSIDAWAKVLQGQRRSSIFIEIHLSEASIHCGKLPDILSFMFMSLRCKIRRTTTAEEADVATSLLHARHLFHVKLSDAFTQTQHQYILKSANRTRPLSQKYIQRSRLPISIRNTHHEFIEVMDVRDSQHIRRRVLNGKNNFMAYLQPQHTLVLVHSKFNAAIDHVRSQVILQLVQSR